MRIVDKDDGQGISILGDITYVADSIPSASSSATSSATSSAAPSAAPRTQNRRRAESESSYLTSGGIDSETARSRVEKRSDNEQSSSGQSSSELMTPDGFNLTPLPQSPAGESSGEDEGWTCDGSTQAELREFKPDSPKLIVCPKAFGMGTIGNNKWANVPKVTCQSCYPRISLKMETLGHILLHEYTHWETLMSPVMQPFQVPAAIDLNDRGHRRRGYGPWEVRQLRNDPNPELMRRNADTYAWLATEIYWMRMCERKHGAFKVPLQKDN
jgi:hypothetical protein